MTLEEPGTVVLPEDQEIELRLGQSGGDDIPVDLDADLRQAEADLLDQLHLDVKELQPHPAQLAQMHAQAYVQRKNAYLRHRMEVAIARSAKEGARAEASWKEAKKQLLETGVVYARAKKLGDQVFELFLGYLKVSAKEWDTAQAEVLDIAAGKPGALATGNSARR